MDRFLDYFKRNNGIVIVVHILWWMAIGYINFTLLVNILRWPNAIGFAVALLLTVIGCVVQDHYYLYGDYEREKRNYRFFYDFLPFLLYLAIILLLFMTEGMGTFFILPYFFMAAFVTVILTVIRKCILKVVDKRIASNKNTADTENAVDTDAEREP
ncbi:MAG: hypothetical protein K6G69_01900 [Lachnospiraceae bacterium]|nr:hypothetical protein [Lachnospiraceae bacterium]